MSEPEKLRRDILRMASEVRRMVRQEAGETAYEELYREALSAFVFGMATAVGKEEGLSAAERNGLMSVCLREVFRYCREEAEQFVRELELAILDTEGGGTAGMVIRRGVEGHSLWKNRETETLRVKLTELLEEMERRERAEGAPRIQKPHG